MADPTQRGRRSTPEHRSRYVHRLTRELRDHPRLPPSRAATMNAVERNATKLLIDRAMRAKVQAQGGRGARRYGPRRAEGAKTVFFPAQSGHPGQ